MENLALELQKCEVGYVDPTMDPSTNVSLQYDALDTVDRQPGHGTRRGALSGSDNVRRDNSR